MQDPRMPPSGELSNPKLRKKRVATSKASLVPVQGNDIIEDQQPQGPLSSRAGQRASKKNVKKEGSPLFQQPEWSNSDSLADSSAAGNEYRALRRKYLLMEEESFALEGELKDLEDEVKALEDEKLGLLDQLVVLEGLVDPSEMPLHGLQLP